MEHTFGKLHYPNPMMVRRDMQDLNGTWRFAFDDADALLRKRAYLDETGSLFDREIVVPYAYQTKRSGIHENEAHDIVWYQREFDLENPDRSTLLHFGAVDYACTIWVNGQYAGSHTGGHTPFTLNISDFVKEHNVMTIRVEDRTLPVQPLGKQSWKDHNFLCWYTRTTGIWQSVWLEQAGEAWVDSVEITPDIDDASVAFDIQAAGDVQDAIVMGEIRFKGKLVNTFSSTLKSSRTRIKVDVSDTDPNFRLHFWSVADPNLYDVTFRIFKNGAISDELESYFGMRDVEAVGNMVYLNNQLFYQKLILDQGYFPEGGLSATAEELKRDVEFIKAMGFNGARKHQKIEDPRYMYLCDVIGLVMWAEMPSFFEYSSLANENVMQEVHAFVAKHRNHPSVIAYTVMNESWGINEVYRDKRQQAFIAALYWTVKSLDSTRLVIGNDGWEHGVGDILTIHDYNSDPANLQDSYQNLEQALNGAPSKTSGRHCYARGYAYNGAPFIISEYGGVAYETTVADGQESWGYGDRLTSSEEVLDKIKSLTKAVMQIDGCCGFCYTQLSDVEQEVNGLLDHNHNPKFDVDQIRSIFEQGHSAGFVFQ